MPKVTRDTATEEEWEEALLSHYESESIREGVHVSDLNGICLLKPELVRLYEPQWSVTTLLRFTMGRALEKAVFKLLLPVSTQELEVREQGIEGHIDFAADPYDYECKLTWSKPDEDPEDLKESKFWWFTQAGSYAVMRRRDECKLVVLHLFPVPSLRCYHVVWTRLELGDLWRTMQERKKYILEVKREGKLPMATPLSWPCGGCEVKYVCPKFK